MSRRRTAARHDEIKFHFADRAGKSCRALVAVFVQSSAFALPFFHLFVWKMPRGLRPPGSRVAGCLAHHVLPFTGMIIAGFPLLVMRGNYQEGVSKGGLHSLFRPHTCSTT